MTSSALASENVLNATVSRLDDIGDPEAPVGSVPWVVHLREQLQTAIANDRFSHQRLGWLKQAMIEHEGYARIVDQDGQPFADFAAFSRTAPPYGLGIEEQKLDAVIEFRKLRATRGRPAKGSNHYGHNDLSPDRQGTSREYAVARLERDRPDVARDLKAGRYPSPHAAAIAAGIRKPDDRIRFLPTIDGFERAIRQHLTPLELAELIGRLT